MNFTRKFFSTFLLCYFFVVWKAECQNSNYDPSISIQRVYDVLATNSQTQEDSVLNTITKESFWVKKNRKIIYLTTGFSSLSDKGYNYQRIVGQIHLIRKKNVQIIDTCKCDLGLFLIESDSIHLYDINFSPGGGSACNEPRNNCNEEGESSKYFNVPKTLPNNYSSNTDSICCLPPTKIAILDTGLILDSLYLNSPQNSELNFFYKKDFLSTPSTSKEIGIIDLTKDYLNSPLQNYHGTKVTNMIIYNLSKEDNVKIIPIKISDSCPGTLFTAMCGLLTAKNMKVDLINASWGYRGDDFAEKLTAKIFYQLQKAGIILITAAGNFSIDLSNGLSNKTEELSQSIVGPCIFPVNFTKAFSNIIGVNTIYIDENQPSSPIVTQNLNIQTAKYSNFSNKFVNLGVMCDCVDSLSIIGEKRPGFLIKGFNYRCYFGTSYAAAKYTAVLSKNVKILKEMFNKEELNGITYEERSGLVFPILGQIKRYKSPKIIENYKVDEITFNSFIIKNQINMNVLKNYARFLVTPSFQYLDR